MTTPASEARTSTVTSAPQPASVSGRARRVTSLFDGLVDAVVVVIGTWTVCYHLALVFDWHRDPTIGLWLVVLVAVGAVAFATRRYRALRSDAAPAPRLSPAAVAPLVIVVVGVAVSAGAWRLSGEQWWAFWTPLVIVLATATLATLTERGEGSEPPIDTPRPRGLTLVAAVGIVLALASAFSVRPEGDDVFVMNKALYVEHRDGAFAERDTIFADEVFRTTRPEKAPASSIEPLIGVGALLTPFTTPTVAYLLVAPAVSFVAVLALWRLLRALRVPRPHLAAAGAAVFLFVDGHLNASLGNFSFARAWQGKVMLVFLFVPIIWHYALAWSRDGDRRALALLFVANTATIGLSSSAAFVATGATLAVVSAGAIQARSLGRWLWGVATTGYLVASTAITWIWFVEQTPVKGVEPISPSAPTVPASAVDLPQSQAVGGSLDAIDPEALWYFVFGPGVTIALVALVVGLGWVLMRERAARLALAGSSLVVVALFYGPGGADWLDDLTGASSVLWRGIWIVPVAALIGALLAAPARLRSPHHRAGWAASALVVALVAGLGTPVTAVDDRVDFGHLAWDIDRENRPTAAKLVEISEPGDIVAAPMDIARILPIISVDVRPVVPRIFELVGSHASYPGFRAPERRLVATAVTTGLAPGQADLFDTAMEALSVDTACSRPALDDDPVTEALDDLGFEVVERDHQCTYWRRQPAETA